MIDDGVCVCVCVWLIGSTKKSSLGLFRVETGSFLAAVLTGVAGKRGACSSTATACRTLAIVVTFPWQGLLVPLLGEVAQQYGPLIHDYVLLGGVVFGGQIDWWPFLRHTTAILRIELREILYIVTGQAFDELRDGHRSNDVFVVEYTVRISDTQTSITATDDN